MTILGLFQVTMQKNMFLGLTVRVKKEELTFIIPFINVPTL